MTKLEWCRANAPDAIKNLPDDEMLDFMGSSYDKFCSEKESDAEEISVPKSFNKEKPEECLDYMVRVLVNEYGNDLTFKGGYMLSKLIPHDARRTQDIDFSIATSELYQKLIASMRTIGDSFVREGIISHYIVKDTIRPTMSGGMDMYSNSGEKILGIDVGWHDLTFGTTTVSLDIATVNAFSTERMIADKLSAILSRKRFRRAKDLYDVYCISNCFNIDLRIVREFMLRREGVEETMANHPFTDVIVREYGHAYDTLIVSNIEGTELEKPSYTNAMQRVSSFLDVVTDANSTGVWDCKTKHIRK